MSAHLSCSKTKGFDYDTNMRFEYGWMDVHSVVPPSIDYGCWFD